MSFQDKFDGLITDIVQFLWSKFFHYCLSDKKMQSFVQFVHFGLVGASNTIISYAIYVGALAFMKVNNMFEKTDYFLAQFMAFVLSVLWSFMLNRKFVFDQSKEKTIWYQALMKTYISYAATGLFLSWILSYVWIEIIGLSKLLAPIVNLIITVPLNFVLNKFWAFK